jgi:adenylyltransferase/sulfurtransferase
MSVTVYIPTPFRSVTANQAYLELGSATVAELLAELTQRYPELDQRLHDDSGQLHRYINIYVNKEEIEDLQGQDTPLQPGDEVSLIPALAGGAIGTPFTPTQVRRYSRHLLLPEVGPVGQRKLLNAKVLLIGAGGLGSPTAFYLAAAGVGTLGIVDFDEVDLSNLQRQILHQEKDVGRPKVDSARETLTALNPDVRVVAHNVPLHADNALEIFADYDIIVNGCDNFPTRYLANDAAYFLRKPLVDGGINQFEGLVSIYMPGDGCYRCLYPAPPPPGAVPSCAEAGVLGALTGLVGSIQATEALKHFLGIGQSLSSRLLIIDALDMSFREVRLKRNPKCPLCGDNPTVTELIDYEVFCGVAAPHEEPTAVGASDD